MDSNKPKVVIVTIPGMIEERDWQELSQKAQVDYVERDKISMDDLLEVIKDTDYLMLNRDVVDELTENFYKGIKERNLPLKAISTDITGMEWANPHFAKQYAIPLLNIPNYSTVSVAEFVITTLLLHVKKLHLYYLDKIQGKPEQVRKNDAVLDKTLGVIGLGHIGTKVAELAHSLGMKVVAWNRTPKSINGVEAVSLDEVFKRADYISINLKTTEETKGLINKQYLSQARDGVIIVNQADGSLVNNDDMLEAIKSGKVGGYTTASESIKGHPLEKEENVTGFPAQAWFTDHSLNLLREIWVENTLNATNGELKNIVG